MELEDYEDYELIEELIERGRVSLIEYSVANLTEEASVGYNKALIQEINNSEAPMRIYDGEKEYGIIPLLHLTEDFLQSFRSSTGITLN